MLLQLVAQICSKDLVGKNRPTDGRRAEYVLGIFTVFEPNQRLKLTGAAHPGFPSFNVFAGGPGSLA
jgi:hypothetical protein